MMQPIVFVLCLLSNLHLSTGYCISLKSSPVQMVRRSAKAGPAPPSMSLATTARRIFVLRKSIAATGVVAAAAAATKPVRNIYRGEIVSTLLYKTEQWLSASALSKSLLIGGSLLGFVLTGGLIYKAVSKNSLGSSIFKSIQFLTNSPGSSLNEEESGASTTVAFSLFFTGLIIFSFFIGLISTDVGAAFDKVAEGQHRIIEKEHTLVMNWNEKTIPVLRQLASAKREGAPVGLPVVVLGNRGKADMDDLIRDGLSARDRRTLRVVTRSGNPSQPTALARVAAASARRVLLLRPTMDSAGNTVDVDSVSSGSTSGIDSGLRQIEDTVVAQTVALQSARETHDHGEGSGKKTGAAGKGAGPRIRTTVISALPPADQEHDIISESTKSAVGFFEPAGKGKALLGAENPYLVVPERSYIPRMIAQAVLHPCICSTHEELTGFQGKEFSTIHVGQDLPPSLLGDRNAGVSSRSGGSSAPTATTTLSVGELRARLKGKGLVCGVLRTVSALSPSAPPATSSSQRSSGGGVSGGFPDDGRTWLFPADSLMLHREDRVVILSPQKSDVRFNARKRARDNNQAVAAVATEAVFLAPAPSPSSAAGPTKQEKVAAAKKVRRQIKKVLVLNWSPRVGGLLGHLDALAAAANSNSDVSDDEHLEVTILFSPQGSDSGSSSERASLQAEINSLRQRRSGKGLTAVKVVEGSSLRREDLDKAGAARANAVLLLRGVGSSSNVAYGALDGRWAGPDGSEGCGPDSSTLVTLSHLHAAIRETTSGHKRQSEVIPLERRRLLVEFASPSAMEEITAVLWRQTHSLVSSEGAPPVDTPLWDAVDTFVPEDLESGALVQIALDANLATVFDRLLDDKGVDIELADIPSTAGSTKGKESPVAFRDLTATQANRRHVVIGIQRPKFSGGFDTFLCPAAEFQCFEADKLVVLAFSENYGGV